VFSVLDEFVDCRRALWAFCRRTLWASRGQPRRRRGSRNRHLVLETYFAWLSKSKKKKKKKLKKEIKGMWNKRHKSYELVMSVWEENKFKKEKKKIINFWFYWFSLRNVTIKGLKEIFKKKKRIKNPIWIHKWLRIIKSFMRRNKKIETNKWNTT